MGRRTAGSVVGWGARHRERDEGHPPGEHDAYGVFATLILQFVNHVMGHCGPGWAATWRNSRYMLLRCLSEEGGLRLRELVAGGPTAGVRAEPGAAVGTVQAMRSGRNTRRVRRVSGVVPRGSRSRSRTPASELEMPREDGGDIVTRLFVFLGCWGECCGGWAWTRSWLWSGVCRASCCAVWCWGRYWCACCSS